MILALSPNPWDYPAGMWCCICNQPEPPQPDDFLYCSECWHVFRTEADLVLADQKVRARITGEAVPPRPSEDIWVCPMCAHDP